ncbi:ectoine hydroxylase [Reichenbachiella agarivorans]|uniref:Ectoine hydroxylase n=1 Tax=Reichenbachiella agarivorans TaxID=2979464 RepID=A0ABY6CS62_9BACT|nr:ectoine hydroxylase [Reichenbachiella agarivorans]UXP33357.1 ectoine hydroxylase [Reichenbachiella agarivorans]
MVLEDLYPSRTEATAQWIDRQDPVVYGKGNTNVLTQEQIENYKRDGFLIIKSVFSQEEIDLYNTEFERLSSDPILSSKEEFIKEPNSRVVRSLFAAHQFSDVYKALTDDERIRAKVEYLLDDETYVHQARINAKPGFNGKEFYWHSDFETWHVEDGMPNMRAISCLITMNENKSYNGSLMLMPGSHNKFVSCVGQTPDDHYKESLRKQEYGVPDQESLTKFYEENGIVVAECPPGSVILFDCNTMHGSNGNITPLARRNIFFVFNAVTNKLVDPFGGTKPRPDFIAHR